MELWHNPRCSKSRQAKALLDESGVAYDERRYLDDPPTAGELRRAVAALGIHPRALVRAADASKAGIDLAALGDDEAEWIDLLAAHPALIERPVVIAEDGRAVIGRPPQAVAELLP